MNNKKQLDYAGQQLQHLADYIKVFNLDNNGVTIETATVTVNDITFTITCNERKSICLKSMKETLEQSE
jgi:hypothetical protein